MRTLSLAACLLCIAAPARGQQTVAIDILGLYGRIPVPPTTVNEAYERARCGEGDCDADYAYRTLAQDLTDIAQRIELALAATSRPAGDPLQGMTPQELQKKMQSMTREEQVEFAMELSRRQAAATAGALKPEPPAVRAALAEAAKVKKRIGQDAANGDWHLTARQAELLAEAELEHGEAGAHATHPRFKDEQGLPGPGWEQAQADAMDMHIAAEQANLQALALAFRDEVARLKALYGPFQAKLAASRYGEDAVNDRTRFELLGMQQGMLRAARLLMDASRAATASGAAWRTEQLEMQRSM